jgi:hypothetical protein
VVLNSRILASVLDCGTYQSSIRALADIYSISVRDAETFLSALDIEEEYRTKDISMRGDEYLAERFQAKFGGPNHTWDRVCWFHLTRVPPNTNFDEGILPLGLALDKIWDSVISAQDDPQTKARLQMMRKTGVPDFQYNFKVPSASLHGPYAMLVREVAFQSDSIGYHDYLGIPEIVEDICNGFKAKTGESILERVQKFLKPCIVKFEDRDGSDRPDDPHLRRTLLYYCWSKCRSEELCYLANTCFDAGGAVIPRSEIKSIEFL